jgi:hypothetical protein
MRNDSADGQAKAAIVDQCIPANKRVLLPAISTARGKILDYYSRTWADMYAVPVILDPALKMDYYDQHEWEAVSIGHARNGLLRAIEAYKTANHHPRQLTVWLARRLVDSGKCMLIRDATFQVSWTGERRAKTRPHSGIHPHADQHPQCSKQIMEMSIAMQVAESENEQR